MKQQQQQRNNNNNNTYWLVLLFVLLFQHNDDYLFTFAMTLEKPPSRNSRGVSNNRNNNNKRMSRNTIGYDRRRSGKVGNNNNNRRGGKKKPPKWEKEGDTLYQTLVTNNNNNNNNNNNKEITFEIAEQMLSQLQETKKTQTVTTTAAVLPEPPQLENDTNDTDNNNDTNNNKKKFNPAFSWGPISVGPMVKQRLVASQLNHPTPIQSAAFAAICHQKNSNNVILSSPTGTGKSLAYLLPLLLNPPRGKRLPGMTMIVTPTVQLAYQLQREVNKLFPEENNKPLLHVVDVAQQQPQTFLNKDNDDDDDPDRNSSNEPLLLSYIGDAPMIAGTPRSLRKVLNEMKQCFDGKSNKQQQQQPTQNPALADNPILGQLVMEMEQLSSDLSSSSSTNNKEDNDAITIAKQAAKAIRSNLHTIVLDEADRLLQTEQVARQRAAKEAGIVVMNKKQQKTTQTQTEQLYQELLSLKRRPGSITRGKPQPPQLQLQQSINNNPYQIICASATVGRTLRRQLMDLCDATSMDQAATLITADARTKKSAEIRKLSLLPETLTHSYQLLPDNNKKDDNTALISALMETIHDDHDTTNGPILIFPGKLGVNNCQELLEEQLLLGDSSQYTIQTLTSSSLSLSLQKKDDKPNDTTTSTSSSSSIIIYVIGEKFGRGLDLPNIRAVLILTPPSSTAGYVHLAGRTGRNGQKGRVVTFCKPKEAYKLVSIAETLGISFQNNNNKDKKIPISTKGNNNKDSTSCSSAGTDDSSMDDNNNNTKEKQQQQNQPSWSHLSESTLKRKTIAEMTDYLEHYGVTLPTTKAADDDDTPKKRIKKSDLLEAIQNLHKQQQQGNNQ